VNCLAVRDLLPELALGVLVRPEREDVERHLRWCAGCRKESTDLTRAAATIGFALEPAATPPDLDDRIVEGIRRSSGRRRVPRRLRTTVSALVAAAVAVSSLGWGAVMAGRADRFEERARRAQQERSAALAELEELFGQLDDLQRQLFPSLRTHEEEETRRGLLTPPSGGFGGGAALQLVSPTTIDFALVIVNGLDPSTAGRLPYRVQLFNAQGEMLRAGRITELDADGGAVVYREFDHTDLAGFTTVRVVDAAGEPVLTGVIGSG
jgi:hypothetical protein